MTCPVCGGETKITDSRGEVDAVRRRRECCECGHRFSTLELDADMYQRFKRFMAAKGGGGGEGGAV